MLKLKTVLLKSALAAATILGSQLLTLPASATPFVDIRAFWSAAPTDLYPLPEGLTVSCWGDAEGGADGCSKTLLLSQPVTASGTYTASSTGGVVITNTSDQTINGFADLQVFYSSFNPGGPHIGISIDDAATQAASFSSTVSGDASDSHSCAVGFLGEEGTVFSPTSCGVSAPDDSELLSTKELIDFLPGAEVVFTFEMFITATFDLEGGETPGVPEPAGLALLGLGALLLRHLKRPRIRLT